MKSELSFFQDGPLQGEVMKRLKPISLALASLMLISACGIPRGTPRNQIQQLVGDNDSFYKGDYGIICSNLYVRKADSSNNLYSSSNTIFSGKAKGIDQLVYIENSIAPAPVLMNLADFRLPKDGVVVLFAKEFVYVLNLSNGDYFKYPR